MATELKGLDGITRQIEVLKQAAGEIRGCREILKVKRVADWGQMIKLAARRVGASLEVQNEATEASLKARHWEGCLLREMPKPKNQHDCPSRDERGDAAGPADGAGRSTLRDLGIGYMESSRAQAVARIPEDKMARAIEDIKANGRELCTEPFVKWGMRLKAQDEGAELERKLNEPGEKAKRAYRRWTAILHEVVAYFARLRQVGGIGAVVQAWDAAQRLGYRDLLRRTGDRFHAVADEIDRVADRGEAFTPAESPADGRACGDLRVPGRWDEGPEECRKAVDFLLRGEGLARLLESGSVDQRRDALGFVIDAIATLESIRDDIAEALAIAEGE
jgi:hypothetical protein